MLKYFGSINTRRIITLSLTLSFCFLSVIGKIDSKEFMTVFTVIIGFYFGGSTALDDPSGRKKGGKIE